MHRWLEEPLLALFPLVGVVACVILFVAIRRRQSLVPFLCGLAIFSAAFATLAVSFYPYMVPFSITIADAVSPAESLSFMFWGAGVFRPADHPDLHPRCLFHLQRESRSRCRI